MPLTQSNYNEDIDTLILMHKETQARIDNISLKLNKIEQKISWLVDPPPLQSVEKAIESLNKPIDDPPWKKIFRTLFALFLIFISLIMYFRYR